MQALGHKAQESGIRMVEVFARGTSRWVYDGSGKVSRDKDNYSLATFSTGKQYNADLNAAYNIAARGLAAVVGLKKDAPGRSPGALERMPLALADVWAWARKRVADPDLSRGTLTGREAVRASDRRVAAPDAPTTAGLTA
ncbi:transposase (plasmid) [Caballeronia sp. S22]